MTIRSLKNITIAKYEAFLELCGCKFIKIIGGHAKYTRCDLNRPIMFQTHIDPVPEFIIKNALRSLGITKNEFHDILDGKITVDRKGNRYILK